MTVIDYEPQPGAAGDDLGRAIEGHAAIAEAIREHAERHALAIEQARAEVARAELERRAAGAGTN